MKNSPGSQSRRLKLFRGGRNSACTKKQAAPCNVDEFGRNLHMASHTFAPIAMPSKSKAMQRNSHACRDSPDNAGEHTPKLSATEESHNGSRRETPQQAEFTRTMNGSKENSPCYNDMIAHHWQSTHQQKPTPRAGGSPQHREPISRSFCPIRDRANLRAAMRNANLPADGTQEPVDKMQRDVPQYAAVPIHIGSEARAAMHRLKSLRWPTDAQLNHTKRLSMFIRSWLDIQIKDGRHFPTIRVQCDIILNRLRPWELQLAVHHCIQHTGSWEHSARNNLHVLEATVRRECMRLDYEASPHQRNPANRLLPIVQLVKKGNLVDADEQIIAHITNCIDNAPEGLTRTIFTKFAYANTYSTRREPAEPGTTTICGHSAHRVHIANLNAQYHPDAPRAAGKDSREHRRQYLRQCLEALSTYIHTECTHPCSVAMPWRVGCERARGNWRVYSNIIMDWLTTANTSDGQPIQVTVYQSVTQQQH